MGNGLSAVLARIDNSSESVRASVFFGQFRNQSHQSSEHCRIFVRHIGQRNNVFFRNNQKVNRCCRIDIVKSEELLILINLFAGNLPLNNLAENAVSHDALRRVVSRLILSHNFFSQTLC